MFRIKTFAVIALPAFALAAGTAWADCPISTADTADGIFVTFADFHVRYDLQSDGTMIEEETYLEDGGGFRVRSLRGGYVMESWDTQYGMIVYNSGEVTRWGVGYENLPVLSPGQTWSDHTTRVREEGGEYLETVNVRVEAERAVTIGPCAYQAWPMVVVTSAPDSTTFTDYLTYLPALGIGIYHGGSENGEAFTRDEPTNISVMPPVQGANGQYTLPGARPAATPPTNPTPAAPPEVPQQPGK